ncbi:MAG: glycoside hydrolase family 57 protein [Verrucomicrobiota bacterium]
MSNSKPLQVVFLWHMHQPYYVDPLEKVALMPWVRLHAVKGYLDMIDVATQTPEVKMNFNFTPVLLRHLLEMAGDEVRDLWGDRARIPAADLNDEERWFVLENFFKINPSTLVQPFPRYRELWELRGRDGSADQIKSATHVYTEEDYRDLQTWYNLAWCGFSAEKRYPELLELKRKGRGFSEEEKNRVLDIHKEIVTLIPKLYREAEASEQVEVTTTPFFHPIMPLVYDTDFGLRAMPEREMPKRFSAPEDVRSHLRLSQEQHQKVFGKPARGLWPSEGSVAPELIPLFKEAGIEYFCTDEDNLFRSLAMENSGYSPQADHLELFQPWHCEYEGASIGALFRERPLSDFIGFNAARNSAEDSAGYLSHHLEHLADVVPHSNGAVTLALDGENAWEAFSDGGEGFLKRMYQMIEGSSKLTTARMTDVFESEHATPVVKTLHTGSWISANFDIWIGDQEENTGWERIGETRAFLEDYLSSHTIEASVEEQAWDAIYAAEGSDWFWWYGPDFQTDNDMLFDLLFRKHLQRVYLLMGETPPSNLEIPIQQVQEEAVATPPKDFVLPVVGGEMEGFYEWMGAGYFDVSQQQTAMFQSDRHVTAIFYGFSTEALFVRVDFQSKFPQKLVFQFEQPSVARVEVIQDEGKVALQVFKGEQKVSFSNVETAAEAVWDKRLEWKVGFDLLGWDKSISAIALQVSVLDNGIEVERYPERGSLEFDGPSDAFRLKNWFI